MLTKSLIAAAVVVPALALSSAGYGQVYQGGPKGGIATRAPTADGKPYAQFVPQAPASGNKHVYRGGPKDVTPHGQNR